MPELPEVETVARQLNQVIKGKAFSNIQILSPSSFHGDTKSVMGLPIEDISRRAKTLIFEFSQNLYILIHLKMTGQLIYVSDVGRVAGGHPSHDFHSALPNIHTRVIFTLDDGTKLYFNDIRKFGWVRVVDQEGFLDYFRKFGPDAVPSIELAYFRKRAERMPRSSIKKFILDQGVISGVGNIYADEALFEAKIAPQRLVASLSSKEWANLAEIISRKLLFAVDKGGTTDNDYVNAFGEKGGMQDYLNVYHKTGSLCPNGCGGVIVRAKVAGRGTHYCPRCQKETQ